MQTVILFIFAKLFLVALEKDIPVIKGESAPLSMVAITPANSTKTIPANQGMELDHDYIVYNKSTKATKKKWFAKRWNFRPPMEPI